MYIYMYVYMYVYVYEYYSAIKKNEIFPFLATQMNLESTVLNGLSHFYVESKKYNELVNKTKRSGLTRYRVQINDYLWGEGKMGGAIQSQGKEKCYFVIA